MEEEEQTPGERALKDRRSPKSILVALTTDLPRLENTGWMGRENSDMLQAIVAALRERSARVELLMLTLRGNPNGLRASKDLAKQGTERTEDNTAEPAVKASFSLEGVKLASGSQTIFYKGILTSANVPVRRHTLIKLDITRHAVKEVSGYLPTDMQIWRSVRDRDIPKSIRGFLWKGIHNAYKIGAHWRVMENLEHRANCGLCGEEENMEHILFECEDSDANKLVWEKAREIWLRREDSWPDITYGTVLGSNLTSFVTARGRKDTGKCRLFRILVTEAAHLIWKIRCERAIQREDPDDFHIGIEIENRWWAAINKRLKMDKLFTDTSRYGKKAIQEKLVLHTWSGVLWNEDNLPDNWVRQSGVLVGMTSRRPPGRNR